MTTIDQHARDAESLSATMSPAAALIFAHAHDIVTGSIDADLAASIAAHPASGAAYLAQGQARVVPISVHPRYRSRVVVRGDLA